MRVWDVSPTKLCRQHLLGEHREVHAIWGVLTKSKRGYSRHPETLRWKGKLKALYLRHEALSMEMARRGYRHSSPLPRHLATGRDRQDELLNSVEEQIRILKNKGCACDLSRPEVMK
jgi:hypothetical protein